MSFDTSRFSFHPWKNYFGVVMQQGRVQLDSDWNEWVAELGRRLQAGTMDTVGHAVVPRTTPEGFRILASPGALSIGRGRMYVDGLLAENHGHLPAEWDPRLAESSGTAPTSFHAQPFLPFNQPDPLAAPANVFNAPALSGGPHLVYLDVWQRELTHLQAPDLVEKAVGVDTTGRLQTVWQVKVLHDVGNATCSTPSSDIPTWQELTRPSGARLSNSTGTTAGSTNPCLAPPTAGYKGLENQLYRVEIHRGGPRNTATFKWSRDNATVATAVREIHGGLRLVVDSLGRDDVLGFHAGEWVEILDDWHELHGLPGHLHRIRPGDGVDAATRSIILETALPAGLFPIDGQSNTNPERHTRVRRWDQSGVVRDGNGVEHHNLNAASTSHGIPVPVAGKKLALENGVLVDFSLIAGSRFKSGDHWIFAARTSDGSIEPLLEAPPLGIHHHYARLAIVTPSEEEQTDCRVFWPPEASAESCDCTVCVHAAAHNDGTATIQHAIDMVRERGGGTICLDVGTYFLKDALNMADVRSLRMRGQGWKTVLQKTFVGSAIAIERGIGVTIEDLSMAGMVADKTVTALIDIAHSVDVHLCALTVAAQAAEGASSAAVRLSGVLLATTIRDCVLVAQQAVVSGGDEDYLLSANLELTGNVLLARQRGVAFDGNSLHYGQLRVDANLVLECADGGVVLKGAVLDGTRVGVERNVLHVTGTGIVAGIDQVRIADNEIVGGNKIGNLVKQKSPFHGIEICAGLDKSTLLEATIADNRLTSIAGHGIHLDTRLGHVSVRNNTVANVAGGALIMSVGASAEHVTIDGNCFTGLGIAFNDDAAPYYGVLLLAAKSADVTNNVFANVARDAVANPLHAAVMAMAVGELRVAENRLHDVGPLEFKRRGIGVAVAPGFTDVAIVDNAITRFAADPKELLDHSGWQAVRVVGWITSLAAVAKQEVAPMFVPGAVLVATEAGYAYLTGAAIAVFANPSSARVHGNRMHSHSSRVGAAEVLGVEDCLFQHNEIRVMYALNDEQPPVDGLAGRLQCGHASVSGNRLFVFKKVTSVLTLKTTAGGFAVLGNLRSAPILVNGVLDNALPAPWNTLNV